MEMWGRSTELAAQNGVLPGHGVTKWWDRVRSLSEQGAETAEYAVATMAAVGFAGLLVVILKSDEVRGMLTDLVRNALTIAG